MAQRTGKWNIGIAVGLPLNDAEQLWDPTFSTQASGNSPESPFHDRIPDIETQHGGLVSPSA